MATKYVLGNGRGAFLAFDSDISTMNPVIATREISKSYLFDSEHKAKDISLAIQANVMMELVDESWEHFKKIIPVRVTITSMEGE